MPAPALTVVVPTHDVAPWVDECLTSIRGQQGIELRVVIVDDHSTDGTLDIVRRHAAEDPRLTVIEAQEHGGGPARNRGLAEVSTEYLAFADGDDLVPPDAYATLVDSLQRSGSDLAVANFFKFAALRTWQPALRWHAFDTRRTGIRLEDLPPLIRNRACWNRVFRTRFWTQESILFPNVPRSNDIVPMVTALVRARTIDVLPAFVYLYRERPGSTSMTARGHARESVESYLTQERECARLIAREAPGVMDEYLTVFSDADGWSHVGRYLDEVGRAGEPVAPTVGPLIEEVLSQADAAQLARIGAQRRVAYALLADGRGEAAAAAVRDADDTVPVLELLRAWADAITSVHASGRVPADELPRLIADLLIAPLLARAGEASTAELAEAVGIVAPLLDAQRVSAIEDANATDEVRRAAGVLLAGDLEELGRLVSLASGVVFRLDAVAASGSRLELRGHGTPVAGVDRYSVSARRMRVVGEHPLGELVVEAQAEGEAAASWSLVVDSSVLEEGMWQLLIRVRHDAFGDVEKYLLAGRRGPLQPESRWARVVVMPRKQIDDRVTLVARPTLVARVVRRAMGLLRRGRGAG